MTYLQKTIIKTVVKVKSTLCVGKTYQYHQSHLLYMFTITVANSELRPLLKVPIRHEKHV